MSERRLEILKKIEQGEISAEEGFRQIAELEKQTEQAPAAPVSQAGFVSLPPVERTRPAEERGKVEVIADKASEPMPDFARWKIGRWVGFALFVIIMAASSVWMIQSWQRHAWGWGFWLSWIPFLIGLAGMAFMFTSHWLYLRVRQKPGETPEKITISMPLPIGLALWVFDTFGQWMPKEVHGMDIAEVLRDVDSGVSDDQPFILQVDEEDGEHVEIFIS